MSVLFKHTYHTHTQIAKAELEQASHAILVNCMHIDAAMQATPSGTSSHHTTSAVPPYFDVNHPAQAQQHVHLLINTAGFPCLSHLITEP